MLPISLEQVYYIAEVIAVAAIVVSIFYLALQVKQSNVSTNMSTVQRINNGFNDFFQSISEDKELAALYRRGLNGLEQLDPDEQVRFITLLNRAFRSCHEMHYFREKQLVDDTVWHTVIAVWKNALQTKGFQEYWAMKKHWYRGSASFQELVEKTFIASGDTRPLYPGIEA